MSAEKELVRGDFDGNTSEFHFILECARDPGRGYDSELDDTQLGKRIIAQTYYPSMSCQKKLIYLR
jgi:hypothetical protein